MFFRKVGDYGSPLRSVEWHWMGLTETNGRTMESVAQGQTTPVCRLTLLIVFSTLWNNKFLVLRVRIRIKICDSIHVQNFVDLHSPG